MSTTQTDQLQRAAEALGAASEVALACHINPDPDALGSMIGLALFLRERGKKVVTSFGNSPFELPRWVHALPGLDAPRAWLSVPTGLGTALSGPFRLVGRPDLAATTYASNSRTELFHNKGDGTFSRTLLKKAGIP